MKLPSLIVLIAVAYLAYSQAQQCPNQPSNPECRGGLDEGITGPDCAPGNRFFFDEASGSCREMRFTGCGGNNNRFCSRAHCLQMCDRRVENCANQPLVPDCSGRRDDGRGGENCVAGTRFHFDVETESCREMHYRGCGGNNNRFCSRRHCKRVCWLGSRSAYRIL